MNKRGYFISIEGVEGVGKSTNLAFLEGMLREAGVEFITTREPGGTEIAEKIRNILLDKSNADMTDTAELMLVFAARSHHLETLVSPALESGKWVICDRFTDSTYAYQGGGRQMSNQTIGQIEAFSINSFQPDITLLLDLPTEIGLARAQKRGELDRFESESAEFFLRVREAFLSRARQYPARFSVIDASQSLDVVQSDIRKVVEPKLESWSRQ